MCMLFSLALQHGVSEVPFTEINERINECMNERIMNGKNDKYKDKWKVNNSTRSGMLFSLALQHGVSEVPFTEINK